MGRRGERRRRRRALPAGQEAFGAARHALRNLSALVASGSFERRWDRASQAPYLWSRERRIFVTYDDPESLRVKSRYIIEHGLGGAMFWEYYADPTGTLLGTLFTELRGRLSGR
ncbi:MAG: hypothetical protein DMF83_20240 [Acidobacteria bacterium]|nr:MAG: hypothetical protein DMF83_20240 [Acidobacteriota bacterium]